MDWRTRATITAGANPTTLTNNNVQSGTRLLAPACSCLCCRVVTAVVASVQLLHTLAVTPLPVCRLVLTGCTWPGASNFLWNATVDDGTCTCGNNLNLWSVSSSSSEYVVKVDMPVPVSMCAVRASPSRQ
jgi:hypothetical protein